MSLVSTLVASLAINGLFFIVAALLRTDVFTDITYALSFLVLSVALFFARTEHSFAQVATALAVCLWALRLGTYLLRRILHIKVDHRFDDKRDHPLRFGLFWLLQAVSVWAIMLPVYGILASDRTELAPAAFVVASFLVFLAGLLIEALSDAQKYRFKMNPATKDAFMATGLWKYSRHPNYFGEILLWWALALPGLFVFRGPEFLYFLGPLFITALLLFVSGIPLLEKSADAKWGKDAAYLRYKRTTSVLVPLPPKKETA